MKLTYFVDKSGRHRWRLRAANGEIVASSSEGFTSKTDMLVNIELTANGLKENRDQWWDALHDRD